jgi:hypothetical protein
MYARRSCFVLNIADHETFVLFCSVFNYPVDCPMSVLSLKRQAYLLLPHHGVSWGAWNLLSNMKKEYVNSV